MFRIVLTTAAVIWALPYTLVGLALGLLGMATGGKARFRGRAFEFYGGTVKYCLRPLPWCKSTVAITFGHTVLGESGPALDRVRAHEIAHVRQYERWGPFFVPAYVLSSLLLWLRGKDPYRDNPFERWARQEAPEV